MNCLVFSVNDGELGLVIEQDLIVTSEAKPGVCRIGNPRSKKPPFAFTLVAYVLQDHRFYLQFTGGMSGRIQNVDGDITILASLRRRRTPRVVSPFGIRSYPLCIGDTVTIAIGHSTLKVRVVDSPIESHV